MTLSVDEAKLLDSLYRQWTIQRGKDEANEKWMDGLQQIAQLGVSIPPEMEPFAFPMNWCRIWVETLEQRMDVRMLIRSGATLEDEELRLDWDANNLDSESHLTHRDFLAFGRCVASVSWPSRELGQTRPVIRIESPKAIAVQVDPLTRMPKAALRVYTDETGLQKYLTLYLPNETIHLTEQTGRWQEARRDVHNLGRVPIIVRYLDQPTGEWRGRSAIEDIKPWVAMAARVVLNLQVAMETISTPQKIAYGLAASDFVDPDTNEPLDEWETYLVAIWAISKSKKDGAEIDQLPAGQLDGFIKTMELITKQVAAATGLPLRMLGHSTVNPASEGGIKADEARLVKKVERLNSDVGVFWSWALGIAERIRTGQWGEGSPIKIEWRNPATPTQAEMADSISKRTGGTPTLSVRGALNEMGYSDARIQQELQWLDEEASGYFTPLDQKLERSAGIPEQTESQPQTEQVSQ
ncbi:phage portal protein [Staphylococcus chromogenes]|nr:phage portal protein [Staphylococcus chromogenes]